MVGGPGEGGRRLPGGEEGVATASTSPLIAPVAHLHTRTLHVSAFLGRL